MFILAFLKFNYVARNTQPVPSGGQADPNGRHDEHCAPECA
jgi:hypothetical protein